MKKDDETKRIGLLEEMREYGWRKAIRTHRFHLRLRWLILLIAASCAAVGLLGFEFLSHTAGYLTLEACVHWIVCEAVGLE